MSRVLRRLGADVTAVYPVGGSMGRLLRRLVDAEDIRSLTIDIVEETRESFTVLEESTAQQFRFVLPGPPMSVRECDACLDALASMRQRPTYVVASGSLPPGIPAGFYAQVARLARDWGARLFLDTSGAALKAALAEGVYLVKPNLHELHILTGASPDDPNSWIAACRAIVARGDAQIVALTLGDQGALLVTREHAWRAAAIPIKPASTVGAGDSFLGALIWNLERGGDLQAAFRYGVASGTAALLASGTELCRRDDVERLVRRARVVDAQAWPSVVENF